MPIVAFDLSFSCLRAVYKPGGISAVDVGCTLVAVCSSVDCVGVEC